VTALNNLLQDAIVLFALSAIPALLVGRVKRPGALSFLKVHAAVFTALLGLALIVFPQRVAVDPGGRTSRCRSFPYSWRSSNG
jgi:hypothetical protein